MTSHGDEPVPRRRRGSGWLRHETPEDVAREPAERKRKEANGDNRQGDQDVGGGS